MKKISAIVVNWNGKEVLSGCLRSLLDQDCEDFEILVVDNGSKDGSQALFKKEFPTVKLIENKVNLGFGPAVNKGFEKAFNELISKLVDVRIDEIRANTLHGTCLNIKL